MSTRLLRRFRGASLADDVGGGVATLARNASALSIARASAATVAANVPRTCPVALVPPADGAFQTELNFLGNAQAISPLGSVVLGGVKYLIGTNGTRLYHKAEGAERWTNGFQHGSGSLVNQTGFCAVGSVILFVVKTSPTWSIWRSTDRGSTAEKVVDLATDEITDNFNIAGHGDTVIFAAYTTAQNSNPKNIYRITNAGQTATIVHTETLIRHFHAVRYHAGTGRWVAIASHDGQASRQAVLVSDDDGLTWSDLLPSTHPPFQPTALLDYGSATKILFGDDTSAQVGRLNLLTGEIEVIFHGWHSGVNGISFSAFQHDGLVYVCGYYTSGSPLEISIIVTSEPDADNPQWVPYQRLLAGSSARFIDVYEGKLQFYVPGGTTDRLAVSPAQKVRTTSGLLITPAASNLISIAETTATGVVATNCTVAAVSSDGGVTPFHGTHMYKMTCTTAGTCTATMAFHTLASNSQVSTSCVVRSPTSRSVHSGLQNFSGTRSAFIGAAGANQWTRIQMSRAMTSGTSNDRTATFYVSFTAMRVGDVAYFDAPMLNLGVPVPHVPIGVAAAADQLSYEMDLTGEWINAFHVTPTGLSWHLSTSATYYIRTWYVDADNYISLYFDRSDSKFKLLLRVEGSNTTLETAATWWHRGADLGIALTLNADETALTICNGGQTLTASGDPHDALRSATITIKSGDNAGENVLPHVLSSDRFMDEIPADPADALWFGEHVPREPFQAFQAGSSIAGAMAIRTGLIEA